MATATNWEVSFDANKGFDQLNDLAKDMWGHFNKSSTSIIVELYNNTDDINLKSESSYTKKGTGIHHRRIWPLVKHACSVCTQMG